jgi:RND family efflux transporter MFP subunit
MRSQAIPLLAVMLTLGGCGGGDTAAPPQPPLVEVVAVRDSAVPYVIELPGRIEAVRSAEVRARTDGIVERRLYEEGTDVVADAPLFAIDPRDKRAQLQQAQAALQRAASGRDNAAQVVRRYRPLVGERAVSAQENDAALSALSQAEADVADARASVSRAQLELNYTTVRAPISGRVGRAQVTEGALVSASGATLMTTVEQLSPIYATFSQSNAEIQNLVRQSRSGELDLANLSRIEVRLIRDDGTDYGLVGRLNFADLSVNPSTGSQTLRATFPNPARNLLPGQFIRGRIQAGTLPHGIVIPQRAVQINNEEATVTVLGGDNIAETRPVELGALIENGWVIRDGLKSGDRVVVDGWQKVRAGQKVRVRETRAKPVSGAPAPVAAH